MIMENKKVALLKPVDEDSTMRGVARVDFSRNPPTISLSVINVSGEGGLYLIVFDENFRAEFPTFSLNEEEFTLPSDFSENSSIAIVKNGEDGDQVLLFGKLTKFAPNVERLLISEKSVYDDEVVATENYYEYEKADYADQRNKNNENAWTESGNSGETEKEKGEFYTSDAENGDMRRQKKYYEKIKEKLDDIFGKYPEVESLSEMVKDSKWVKIPYGEGKHYVVGIEYENGAPRWICYGVPGKYGERPTEISGYCSFLPSSPFELKSWGYWIMFQDALSGQRIEES